MGIEDCVISFKTRKVGVNLLSLTNYNIAFHAVCETEDETAIQLQLISHTKLAGHIEITHHEGKIISLKKGGEDYICSLGTKNITLPVESFLIIAPIDLNNTYVTLSGINVEQSDMRVDNQAELIKKSGIITFVSTWEINCGIAIYTWDLLTNLNNIMPGIFTVHSLNKNPPGRISGTIVHLQNEIGLMPQPPDVDSKSKVIITWHTIPIDMSGIISAYENKMNVVAHIVASEDAAKPIRSCSNKDVHVINIGSAQIPLIDKQHARQLLNISVSKPVGFVFGFQSINKNYHELKKAANNTGIHLIISGAKNDNEGSNASMPAIISKDVTFINRYLSELEVSLYALASDILLFDYAEQKHYSASAAMHRIIGAGRPVICSNIKHFSELTDGKNALKFSSQKELEDCINKAIGIDNIKLSKGALEYATETSWPIVAKKHMEIYQKYINFEEK